MSKNTFSGAILVLGACAILALVVTMHRGGMGTNSDANTGGSTNANTGNTNNSNR